MKHDMPVPVSLGASMNVQEVMKSNATSSSEQFQKRRSSSRSIKRKKFDDELVESSLVKTSRARPPSGLLPILQQSVSMVSPAFNTPTTSTAAAITISQVQNEPVAVTPTEKRKSRPSTKRVKRSKSSLAQLSKDIGRWKPADDLNLILSVQQTNDLQTVFRGVVFSNKFTLQEIQERWYALLYNAAISKPAFAAMKQMNPDAISNVQANVLFSAEEEKLVASVPSICAISFQKKEGSLEAFKKILESNQTSFLHARTAKVLFAHWTLLKKYNLLLDQKVLKATPSDTIISFSDAEELIDDSKLKGVKDEDLKEEMTATDRIAKREIRQLENELPKWQVLVDSITGTNNEEFNSNTLAILKGRIVRYLMQSREITLGRSSRDGNIDIDLSLEGPAGKISRRQGLIKMENSGDFYLVNEGKRPFYVDGRPVALGSRVKLGNNSVVEIVGLRFIFLVNHEYLVALRNKS